MVKKIIEFLLTSKLVYYISRFALGGLFVYAGLIKVLNLTDFRKVIIGYKLLPDVFIPLFSVILPVFEIILGLMLIAGIFEKIPASFLISLLVVFILAIGINLIRGNYTDCGCFSKGIQLATVWHGIYGILRDILFILMGFIVIFRKGD
jgi:putative oxidoreductase